MEKINVIEKIKTDIDWVLNEFIQGTELDYKPNRMAVQIKMKEIREALAIFDTEKLTGGIAKFNAYCKDMQEYAEAYYERRMKEAQAIMDAEPRGMIASGLPGPMSLNAQLKRCEAYHAKKCADCTKEKLMPRFEKRSGILTDVAVLPDAENQLICAWIKGVSFGSPIYRTECGRDIMRIEGMPAPTRPDCAFCGKTILLSDETEVSK